MPTYKISVDKLGPDWISLLRQRHEGADLEIRVVESEKTNTFTTDDFWQIINLLDWSQEEDNDAVIEPAVHYLSTLDISTIYRFQDELVTKLYQLDKEIYAIQLGPEAPSDDGAFSSDYCGRHEW